MREEEFKDFRDAWLATLELYTDKIPSEIAIDLVFQSLYKFDLIDVLKGMSKHSRTSQFKPKPADIIAAIEGGAEDRSELAWVSVRKNLGRVGADRSVVFDDPILILTVQGLGGWVELCESQVSELPFIESRFKKLYQANCRTESVKTPSKLIGRAEHQGRESKPVFIGDAAKCASIYALAHEAENTDDKQMNRTELMRRIGLTVESGR